MLDVQDLFILGSCMGLLTDLIILGDFLLQGRSGQSCITEKAPNNSAGVSSGAPGLRASPCARQPLEALQLSPSPPSASGHGCGAAQHCRDEGAARNEMGTRCSCSQLAQPTAELQLPAQPLLTQVQHSSATFRCVAMGHQPSPQL